MDWLESSISAPDYHNGNFSGLYDYFENIRIVKGAINIPKEACLFICGK